MSSVVDRVVEDRIAKVAHEAVDAWREVIGEQRAGHWEDITESHREGLRAGVRLALAGASAEDLHKSWVAAKRASGVAQHALFAPYSELPDEQRQKDRLVQAIARTLGCGVERWAVKTGTDPDAAQVNMTAQLSTVAELAALPAPPPDPPARVLGGPEFQVFTIDATVSAVKIEADSDYHLALADDQGNTMIAEAACPGCASGSLWLDQITAARSSIEAAISDISDQYQDVNRKATLTGVGFFDKLHGQRGVASNGIELHPLLAIEFH